jgi:hypothetical protein
MLRTWAWGSLDFVVIA